MMGRRGATRLAAMNNARLTRPYASACRSIAGACSSCASDPSRPISAGSCEAMINSAAAWLKPVSTGELTRFSTQAERVSPTASCTPPASNASHTASTTQLALAGCAMPTSDAPTRTLLRAEGPTDSRVEALNRTAATAGRKVA